MAKAKADAKAAAEAKVLKATLAEQERLQAEEAERLIRFDKYYDPLGRPTYSERKTGKTVLVLPYGVDKDKEVADHRY